MPVTNGARYVKACWVTYIHLFVTKCTVTYTVTKWSPAWVTIDQNRGVSLPDHVTKETWKIYISLSMFRTPICRCEPPTLSLAECHRKRMVVVCTELLLALKHVLRQLPDTVERLAPSRCRRLAGNATYQLHANSTSGRSEKPGQHRCNPSVEARSGRSLQNISTAVILYYYCCFV